MTQDPEEFSNRRTALLKFSSKDADLPGRPNFQLYNSPSVDPDLRDILEIFPDLNELWLIVPKNPSAALSNLAHIFHSLKSLRLSSPHVPILPYGLESLVLLIHGPHLKNLRLCTVKEFGSQELKVIAGALPNSRSLTTLSLTNIEGCGSEGARFIAEGLKTNTSLTRLQLSGCKIGIQGASFIFDALKYNSSLQRLELTKDRHYPTFDDILDEARHSKCMELKSLKEDDLFIWDPFRKNTTLTHLDLSQNCLGIRQIKNLCSALEDNSLTGKPLVLPVRL